MKELDFQPSDEWMETASGLRFTPLNPDPADIVIEDISRGLSLFCRYGGQCQDFYSVAEHSVRASYIVPEEDRLEALMHDSAEAYIGDMIRPLKRSPLGVLYCQYEDALMQVIAAKFGFRFPFPRSVKVADNVMLFTEKRDIKASKLGWSGEQESEFKALTDVIHPWKWDMAEHKFLNRFHELTEGKWKS